MYANSLFSVLFRDDFRPDNDVDVLVDFEPDFHRTLFDLVAMSDELKEIFGLDIDLLTRRGVEQSRNYIRCGEILSSMEVLNVA